MSRNLFVTATEPRSGKSAISLGVMELLVRNAERVAFFRPLINSDPATEKKDNDIDLISSHYKLGIPYGDCAVNPDPNAERLAEIALSSAQTARIFGIEPRVAMLSYSTLTRSRSQPFKLRLTKGCCENTGDLRALAKSGMIDIAWNKKPSSHGDHGNRAHSPDFLRSYVARNVVSAYYDPYRQ